MIKLTVIFCLIVTYVHGHGMVIEPVNRASRWRVDSSAIPNYNDNQLWYGGAGALVSNEGRCGMCGDNFATATPRPHELGGRYGEGVIVQSYTSGSLMTVVVRITANHRGYFEFRLCNMDKFGIETDACYNDILLSAPSGDTQHYFPDFLGNHEVDLRLPSGLTCQHCILQWTYYAANTRENYKTCSDITIAN